MLKKNARARGFAMGQLRASIGEDTIISDGTVFVNGDESDNEHRFLMGYSGLVWAPRDWMFGHSSTESTPIDRIEFDLVKSFRVTPDGHLFVVHITEANRTVSLIFLPTTGLQTGDIAGANNRVVRILCGLLSGHGAEGFGPE